MKILLTGSSGLVGRHLSRWPALTVVRQGIGDPVQAFRAQQDSTGPELLVAS